MRTTARAASVALSHPPELPAVLLRPSLSGPGAAGPEPDQTSQLSGHCSVFGKSMKNLSVKQQS